MSTETTNKKIKIDNGTTFGRTYTDKAVDELLKNVGGGLNILDLNLKNCMNESDYNELFNYILQDTVIAKTYNITLPDLTDVDIVRFTVETSDGNMNTTFYRNSKAITQFNWLCNWTNNDNFMQMVTITGNTDNNVNYIKYNGIYSGGDIWLDITPYMNEDITSISQEGYDLVYNAFSLDAKNPNDKYVGILLAGIKMFYNEFITSDKTGLNFISNSFENGIKRSMSVTIYNDKSVEAINSVVPSSSNKIWYNLYLDSGITSGTITQEQYNEIKKLIDSNSLAGIAPRRMSDNYFPLSNSLNGTFTFRFFNLTNKSNTGEKIYTIYRHEIIIKPDLSVSSSSGVNYIPLLTPLPGQSIISIKTDGSQENLTVGDGLKIENGALKATGGVFDITPYLTSSTSISVEGYNALREFVVTNKGGISKVLINSDYFYYTLCQLNESGMLFTKVGGEAHESGDTVVVSLMVTSDGSCTFISNAYTPVKANPTESATGTLSKIRIGNGVYSVVDEAKVNQLINSKIGDINSILDNINGEVI